MNAAPIHDHSAATIDLAQGFDGSHCPEVYKHLNLMWDPADNPMAFETTITRADNGI